ncbi:MAG: cob(I)yrinic acid a,c-diamide adenosyltransferase [Cyclobacteriaceae bacterium]
MKIYTKTGDSGTTGLFGGKRVSKSDLRIEAYGTVDELNSNIGLLRDHDSASEHKQFLLRIQKNLFVIGSILAAEPGNEKVKVPELPDDEVSVLEKAMDEMDAELPPMRNFVLPGGHMAVSQTHITRCVCRRAERRVVALFDHEKGEDKVIHYLNRLSDYFFVLARYLTLKLGVEETPWIPGN